MNEFFGLHHSVWGERKKNTIDWSRKKRSHNEFLSQGLSILLNSLPQGSEHHLHEKFNWKNQKTYCLLKNPHNRECEGSSVVPNPMIPFSLSVTEEFCFTFKKHYLLSFDECFYLTLSLWMPCFNCIYAQNQCGQVGWFMRQKHPIRLCATCTQQGGGSRGLGGSSWEASFAGELEFAVRLIRSTWSFVRSWSCFKSSL